MGRSWSPPSFSTTPTSPGLTLLLTRWRIWAALSTVLLLATLYIHPPRYSHEINPTPSRSLSPADQFEDNVVPYREQASWDISTDFPYPRKLSFEVQEGTWLSLDVHPSTGEIIFDMLGDLYCVAGSGGTAHAVTRGIPHDVQPRFSPDGTRLAWRSDAGLGVDNIWVMPWTNCAAMALQPEAYLGHPFSHSTTETLGQRQERLLLEGRLHAYQITNETFRYLSDPRWHPSGKRIIATKWYTGRITIAGGEGWEYAVPLPPDAHRQVPIGTGSRLVERNLPNGWPASEYNTNPIGPEMLIWDGASAVIYALNTANDDGVYRDSKDVFTGVYSILRRDILTGKTTTLISATPGGASRPELSRDGRTLAFVRRVRDKEALVFLNLQSGTIRNVWYGLSWDVSAGAAAMGTYPGFAFSPNDKSVVIWASGHIWTVPLKVDLHGELVSAGQPKVIPFTARVEKRLAETLRPQLGRQVRDAESAPKQQVYAMKSLDIDNDGSKGLFTAEGTTYLVSLVSSDRVSPVKVPVLQPELPYYSPSFSASSNAITHVRWSNQNLSTIEIVPLDSSNPLALTSPMEFVGLPWHLGRYYAPALCACGKHLAFARFPGDAGSGAIVATAGTGVYIATLQPSAGGVVAASDVRKITNDDFPIAAGMFYAVSLRLSFPPHSCEQVLVRSNSEYLSIDIADQSLSEHTPLTPGTQHPFTFGSASAHSQTIVVAGHIAEEVVSSSDDRYVAFAERMQVYIAPLEAARDSVHGAYARPANATAGIVRVSDVGGHDVTFSGDSSHLFWLSGPNLNRLHLSRLSECQAAAKEDVYTFGVDCITSAVDVIELVVEYDADSRRLRREARAAASDPDNVNADILVLTNATLITMHSGREEEDVITDGVVVARDGLIVAAGSKHQIDIPTGAHVIDVQGGQVLPGFIDVHAHYARTFTFPVANWQFAAMLAYGVTTIFNPSHSTVGGFSERFLLESPKGHSIGPRIFQTGEPLFASEGWPMLHQEIADMREARDALGRIRGEGGLAGLGFKSYQLPVRASRQRLLLEGRNQSLICVPEGGMNFHWMLTYIIDGMTSVEHAMVPSLVYDDVLTLWAFSGTATTPTMIVGYAGAFGEEFVWASRNVAEDEKIRRFIPHAQLEQHVESTARPWYSYSLYNISRTTAELIKRGAIANIGAHGEPPIGLNFHSEMRFFLEGGLTPYEVLRSATRMPARSLGLFDGVGSLETNKLADMVVYPPEVDVLSSLNHSERIRFVIRGGRVRRGDTLEEVWPVEGRMLDLPVLSADE
ncbi:hypothetical protein BKA62DRAFT_644774 [Auriculariales sp. MPI-PUGE-AT-0066]|nr:hypothetical protein BKA62DRAFT_644774 [Auriculariales sp. MPI-PUGE-AT-0066]